MLVVAGLSLKNLDPRVWDSSSEYHLPALRAVMISYADFHVMRARRKAAMEQGLRAYLGVPKNVKVFLDNGAFFFRDREGGAPHAEYVDFVKKSRPDWYPIPQDFIPTPGMRTNAQEECLRQTMEVNRKYEHDGYVPVMHVSRVLRDYVEGFRARPKLVAKRGIALGGIVPNLLRAPRALPYPEIISALGDVRSDFESKSLHVFGMGGTATLHIAALLKLDSVDSSGWRNRAARGLIQLPGTGDRMVTDLGNWRGRKLDKAEKAILAKCGCPACCNYGIEGLRAKRLHGFCNRATHNLWVLLKEAEWLADRLEARTYGRSFRRRLDNTVYLPIIEALIEAQTAAKASPR